MKHPRRGRAKFRVGQVVGRKDNYSQYYFRITRITPSNNPPTEFWYHDSDGYVSDERVLRPLTARERG